MMHATKSEQESTLTGHRFFLLFLLLLGTLILYPYAEASRFGYYAFRVIGTAATLISVLRGQNPPNSARLCPHTCDSDLTARPALTCRSRSRTGWLHET
jgi:hypothetical protein